MTRKTNIFESAVVQWMSRGASAVSDQGLFALSNFIVNVVLARWLSPAGYGAFSLAFAIFLLLGTLHTGMLADPMLVFGSAKYRPVFRTYMDVLVRAHWVGSILVAGILAIIALAMREASATPVMQQSVLGLAVATPFILLQWLARRACYAILKPHYAAYAGAAYMVLLLGLVYSLYETSQLNAFTALASMGVASLVSALGLMKKLGLRIVPSRVMPSNVRSILNDHWSYGRWAASTHLIRYLPFEIYYVLLAIWAGLESTGTMKANMNLVLPIFHGFTALGIVLVPTLVRLRGTPGFDRLVKWAGLGFSLTAIVYWILLGSLHEQLLELLYGDAQYGGSVMLGWALGLVAVARGPQPVFGGALLALERPDQTFRAYAVAGAFTLSAGVALLATFDVLGAVLGIALANAVATMGTWWMLRRLTWNAQL